MKINILKELFLDKLNLASKFTSTKFSTLTHLQGILLEGRGDEINIYSTNLSAFFHTKIKIKQKVDFKVVIDPKKIVEVLNLMQSGNIDLEITDKQITLSQDKTKTTFPLSSFEDFPLPPPITDKLLKIKTEFLVDKLPLVIFSSSQDETRPVLTGINFITQDEEMLVVATDGFRLSLLKTKKQENIPAVIIPRDFLYEVIRLLKEEKEVEFGYLKTEKMVFFRIGDDEFYSRLIEGEYPDFEKVIPVDKKTTCVIEREEFLRNIKLTAVVARDFSNIIICDLKKEGLYIRPKTDTEDGSETFQEMEFNGEEQSVAFNFKFLIDFLNNINSKTVTMEVLRPDAPVVFKQAKDPNFLHIVMPIRIQQ